MSFLAVINPNSFGLVFSSNMLLFYVTGGEELEKLEVSRDKSEEKLETKLDYGSFDQAAPSNASNHDHVPGNPFVKVILYMLTNAR